MWSKKKGRKKLVGASSSRLVFPLLQYIRANPGRARFRRRFRRLPLSCGCLVGPGGDGEPRVRRAECILANRLVLGTLVLAPPMTAIRHGRELCLPGDDVEARSTSLQRNKCLHPSRHDGVGSGAILRYGWLDLSSSVFYDYCGGSTLEPIGACRSCFLWRRPSPLLLEEKAWCWVCWRGGVCPWFFTARLGGLPWPWTRCAWGASPAAALHRVFARPLGRLLLRLLRKLRRFGAPSWFLVVVAVSGSWC